MLECANPTKTRKPVRRSRLTFIVAFQNASRPHSCVLGEIQLQRHVTPIVSRHHGTCGYRQRHARSTVSLALNLAMRELSHTARDWLRRVRRAWRKFFYAASVAVDEYRIRYELTACLKFKDAAGFLPEWIEFHQMVGFEHFYLYNNNSTDDYRRALAPYCEEGSVTLYEWPHVPAFPKSDEHCVAHHRHEARWIAFLNFFFRSMGRIFERF